MSFNEVGKMIKCIDLLIARNAHQIGEAALHKELTPIQNWVIGYLYHNRDKTIYQKDLELEFGLPKSTLASLVKGIEEKGFITRVNAKHDSRLKRIVLTERALALQKDVHQDFQRINDYICGDLSQEEISSFLEIGQKMKDSLERRLKTAGKE